MKVLNYLHDCFKPPRVHMPITEQEQIALTNLIQVSKERVWLTDNWPKRPEPSFDYSEDLDENDIETINKSLKIVTSLLQKHKAND